MQYILIVKIHTITTNKVEPIIQNAICMLENAKGEVNKISVRSTILKILSISNNKELRINALILVIQFMLLVVKFKITSR